jgi:hypothetical protein
VDLPANLVSHCRRGTRSSDQQRIARERWMVADRLCEGARENGAGFLAKGLINVNG